MARGVYFDLRPLYFYPTLARPSSTPAKCLHRLLQDGPQLLQSRTKIFLLQAIGASRILSLRTRTPNGGGGELGVEGSARCGGAHDRTRVRTRVNARAWQGLRRRFKAPRHPLKAFRKSSTRFRNRHGTAEESTPSWRRTNFFSPFLAKPRTGLV